MDQIAQLTAIRHDALQRLQRNADFKLANTLDGLINELEELSGEPTPVLRQSGDPDPVAQAFSAVPVVPDQLPVNDAEGAENSPSLAHEIKALSGGQEPVSFGTGQGDDALDQTSTDDTKTNDDWRGSPGADTPSPFSIFARSKSDLSGSGDDEGADKPATKQNDSDVSQNGDDFKQQISGAER